MMSLFNGRLSRNPEQVGKNNKPLQGYFVLGNPTLLYVINSEFKKLGFLLKEVSLVN